MSDDDWGDAPVDDGDEDWGDAGDDNNNEWGGDAMQTDEHESMDVKIANIFYEAEDMVRDHPQQALAKFLEVLSLLDIAQKDGSFSSLSDESRTAGFNSQVHIVLLLYQLDRLDEMIQKYQILLASIPKVTRNESADAIERVLNTVSHSRNYSFLKQLYTTTISGLQPLNDVEKILFQIQIKLCKTLLDNDDMAQAQSVLNTLLRACQDKSGQDDKKNKGSELLEIYALQIKISSKAGDAMRMKELYEKTKDLTAAVKDPRSQSVIRECWGMMFGEEGNWSRAYAEFYSAFTHYQEIGARDKAKQCLKYVVVSNLLSGGEQNPFDAREAKVYQSEPDVAAIGALRTAYEKCEVDAFSNALEEINKQDDKFIRTHLDSMILDFQSRAILQILKSYRRLKLSWLAARLRVSPAAVQHILVKLILDGEIAGKIDQVGGYLDCTQHTSTQQKKFDSLEALTNAINKLTQQTATFNPQ